MNYSKLLISFGLLLSSALVANAQEAVDKTNSTDEKETFRITVNTNSPSTWALEWQDDFDQGTIDEENGAKLNHIRATIPIGERIFQHMTVALTLKTATLFLKELKTRARKLPETTDNIFAVV